MSKCQQRLPRTVLIAFSTLLITWFAFTGIANAEQDGPIHLLFLGHEKHNPHNPDRQYPIISKALGPEAIYFEYTRSVDRALDPDYLKRFDGLVLYANHTSMTDRQMDTLENYVEDGHAFIPIHSASACFRNRDRFIDLVGAEFKSHGAKKFTASITKPDHPAMQGVTEFRTWDETYVHKNHNKNNRTVLMRRNGEPWTWVRKQGEGRVFYTAYGHDQRTWSKDGFQKLLKSGILWAVGEDTRKEYHQFLSNRAEKRYERREKIPNYRRDEKLPYQFPMEPEDSMDYTTVPPGFDLELFASEPQVVDPMSMTWDRQGRLWVVESTDYPNHIAPDNGNDRIKILEDTNDDGRADEVTVFAKNLNIPSSITFSNGGVIVAMQPYFLFLKDTDGDDRADVRKKMLSGWGNLRFDTHAGPSNLRYGFDNWLYGTVGYSGFQGTVGGETHKFGWGVYRFKPDGSDIEFLYRFNNNTWGLGFNRAGDVFGSTANGNPSFFCGIPETLFPDGEGTSAEMIATSASIQPVTPRVRQVDQWGKYSAGAGHAFVNSNGFPPRYRNRVAFINEPTGHLIGMYRVTPDGAGYRARNMFSFMASADEWFSPVHAEVGPDGALWVADWYDFIIQHNPPPRPAHGGFKGELGKGGAHVNPNRDDRRGRIYRVVWKGAEPSKTESLAGASTVELIRTLGSDNQFWRMTAQRILVQERDLSSSHRQTLKNLVQAGTTAGVHALWTLEGHGALGASTLRTALNSDNPELRKNACRALKTGAQARDLLLTTGVLNDDDPGVRLKALNALVGLSAVNQEVEETIRELQSMEKNTSDTWLKRSLNLAATVHDVNSTGKKTAYQFGKNLLPNPSFENTDSSGPAHWQVRHYAGQARHEHSTGIAHSGSHALNISSKNGADTSFYGDVSVEPDTVYRLSGWVKTKNVRGAKGALFNVHEIQGSDRPATTPAVSGTTDWTRVEVTFNSGDHESISINCLFGGWGKATGTAWYDDVKLQKGTIKGSSEEK